MQPINSRPVRNVQCCRAQSQIWSFYGKELLQRFLIPENIYVLCLCVCLGLETFCQDPAVLKKFETMASGKILLAEILERGQTPLVVLYDTSQDDDININAACMKALHDKSLASPLQVPKWLCVNTCGYACGFVTQQNCFYGCPQVNSAYMNVAISSVCSDGTIYCQPPSRGLTKMNETLEKIETYFHSQVNACFVCCLRAFLELWYFYQGADWL